jgi:hypothetical protein
MADVGCKEAMTLLNIVFQSALIMNDGHEIHARLSAGDHPAEVVVDLGKKFDRFKRVKPYMVEQVIRNWPEQHMEAVGEMVKWALSKLDTDDRISISWKGDADYPETVTRFELRGNHLQIEFLHPPARAEAAV